MVSYSSLEVTSVWLLALSAAGLDSASAGSVGTTFCPRASEALALPSNSAAASALGSIDEFRKSRVFLIVRCTLAPYGAPFRGILKVGTG